MAESMHKIVFIDIWMVVQKSRFSFIFVDEVIIVDCQPWLVVHMYFVDG
jgi:hypothetical protein